MFDRRPHAILVRMQDLSKRDGGRKTRAKKPARWLVKNKRKACELTEPLPVPLWMAVLVLVLLGLTFIAFVTRAFGDFERVVEMAEMTATAESIATNSHQSQHQLPRNLDLPLPILDPVSSAVSHPA
mmetsp:Transcript_15211/g.21154  ORF Transcript_15211/g.21154 Transcript_15211/m.21154 type:complete len:127 (-) Transcript_15211:227-607(-)|eukprot:CAMPEP_0185254200 /NCGR_PEP_ID=MMETSP1359-20130426/2887_1 /TAXON_ID=552665 /ORGANISM="Bigelowiella longifila, Strain CCMP242" /LENGTH=126 /DNA_ID=CAMNT_0027836933 /DNA_START=109 /DNA_END=489 /DNA_ORIENTATION=-